MDQKNIVDKIWDAHVVKQKVDHPAVFAIDFTLLHEVTSPQAFAMLKEQQLPVYEPQRCIATLDHSIPTRRDRHIIHDIAAKKQVDLLRKNCAEFGVTIYDYDSQHQGIVHVIGPELGVIQPGMTIVCGDSHTSTHGAFGALAFGIGTSELGYVLATGCLLAKKPKVMKVEFHGKFQPGVYAKDAILKLISQIGIGGATDHIIEYCGDTISNMSMEERMTICNMSIECGARAGLIAPDEKTFAFIRGKPYAPKNAVWQNAVDYWRQMTSDPGCHYDKTISINVTDLKPMVSWGTNPQQTVAIDEPIPLLSTLPIDAQPMAKSALAYTQLQEGQLLEKIAVDWAFIGSCTNGRIEDLRIVAAILDGHKVNDKVTMYIVPGSEGVLAQAKAEGLDKVFNAAGAQLRLPGCSMCLGMNDDQVPAGKRCISSTNRNFVGRQGKDSYTHLASPATVAASAIAGFITAADQYL